MASINGRIVADGNLDKTEANGSGGFDPGIAGQTIQLLNASGTVIQTTVTDQFGIYGFTGLPGGQYRVVFPTSVGDLRLAQAGVGFVGIDSDPNPNSGTTALLTVSGSQNLFEVDAVYGVYIVDGTSGNDVLTGGYVDAQGDAVDGRDGDADLIDAGAGADFIGAGLGADTVFAGDGADWVFGDEGDDQLFGGAGNDTLVGGSGADTIFGGAGDDLVAFDNPFRSDDNPETDGAGDTIFGGAEGTADNDTLDLRGLRQFTLVQEADPDDPGATRGVVTLQNGASLAFEGIETLLYDKVDGAETGEFMAFGYTDADGDTIGDGADTIFGNGGDDDIRAGGGNDSVDGGSGNEFVDASSGNDTVLGGDGNDDLRGGDGNDSLDGGIGADFIDGGVGADTILGGAGADDLRGGDGNDSLDGGGGADFIDGGVGDDTILGGAGADDLRGGDGNDSLDGGGRADFIDGGVGADTILGGADTDDLRGGDGNDLIYGGEGADSLWGGSGDDLLAGGDGADTLEGGAGNDTLEGGAGDDVFRLLDGFGSDVITGGVSDEILGDRLDASALTGNVTVLLDEGSLTDGTSDATFTGIDIIETGVGDDFIDGLGSTADITILAGDGDDLVWTGLGNDSVDGGAGDDLLIGDAGDDSLAGGEGNDFIEGDAGDDTLSGGAGRDTVSGGAGRDVLTGGAGADVFIASGTADIITDFDATTGVDGGGSDDNDFIDLSAFYNEASLADRNAANPSQTFNNALAWLKADNADGVLDAAGGLQLQGVASEQLSFETVGVVCFAAGTLIATDRGDVRVEALRAGDLVQTLDHGLQPLRWIGSRHVSARELAENPKLRPIRIPRQATGLADQTDDLILSPQHRVMVASRVAERVAGTTEVLIPAVKLVGSLGVARAEDMQDVTYYHLLFDRHEIVFSNGVPSESLHLGSQAQKSLASDAWEEIVTLFPHLACPDIAPSTCRPVVDGKQAKILIYRHAKNEKPLLQVYDTPCHLARREAA